VPGFAGFFSKDMVLEAAYMSGHMFVWLLVWPQPAAPPSTSSGLLRCLHGESRVDPEKWVHLHEMPAAMTVPLVILACCR